MHGGRRWRSRAVASLCELAAIREPENALLGLLDSLLASADQVGPQADLGVIGSFRKIRRVEARSMVEAGRLVREGLGYVVQVNERHAARKRRFTVAHEICHTFFREAQASVAGAVDRVVGLFEIRQEEEYLCDLGAGHIILHPSWFVPLAAERVPSIEGLLELADMCDASIEATAYAVTNLGVWSCSCVLWEPGLRKGERQLLAQAAFEGWENLAAPQERLRAKHVYSARGAPLLPRNKSVSEESEIFRAFRDQTTTAGKEVIDLGNRAAPARCESTFAPYHDERGNFRARVVTVLNWDGHSADPRPSARSAPAQPGLKLKAHGPGAAAGAEDFMQICSSCEPPHGNLDVALSTCHSS